MKKTVKKLRLAKETVRRLTDWDLNPIAGGTFPSTQLADTTCQQNITTNPGEC